MDKKFVQEKWSGMGTGELGERLRLTPRGHRGKPGAHLDFTGLGQVLSNAYCQ